MRKSLFFSAARICFRKKLKAENANIQRLAAE
jgi:hypothetical protein